MKRIFFDENKFVRQLNSLKQKAKTLSDFVSMYKNLGLGKLPESDIIELIQTPEQYVKKAAALKINSAAGISILGFRIKADKVFEFVEEGPAVTELFKYHIEKIKKWDYQNSLSDLELSGYKFSVKQNAIEALEKECSIYINSDQEIIYNELETITKCLNQLSILTKENGFHTGFHPLDLEAVCKRSVHTGEIYVDPNIFSHRF